MSPEKARVFVVEDEKRWKDLIKDVLTDAGHSVVLTAQTREQALAAVPQLRGLGVQVAIIDGNLSPYNDDGADGKALLAAMRAQAPEVKTVGMSRLAVRGVDVNVGKMNASKLGEVVKKL